MKIDVLKIRFPSEPLRIVDTNTESYQSIRSSIKRDGLLNPISVFDLGNGEYELIDGSHRLQSHIDNGMTTIEVLISEADRSDSLRLQLMHNVHRIEVKPVDNAKAIKSLIDGKKITIDQLSKQLRLSKSWILIMLTLAECDDEELAGLINSKKIPIANAVALLSLPRTYREELYLLASTYNISDFKKLVTTLKRKKFADRTSMHEYVSSFVHVGRRFRGFDELELELRSLAYYQKLKDLEEFKGEKQAWLEAIRWTMSLDKIGKVEIVKTTRKLFRKKTFKGE